MLFTPTPAFVPNDKADEEKKRLKRRSFCCTGILGATGAVLVALGAILLIYLPDVIRFVGSKEHILREGTLTFPYWRVPPIPLYFNVYLFNITNYKEYRTHNAKPIVQEVGPYVYRQKWVKNKLKWYENGTVSYVQNKTFTFIPEMSSGTEDDVIYTINIPMVTAAWMFKNAGPVLKVVLTTVFTVSQQSFVMNVTVKEILWDGYDDPILKAFRTLLPNARYPYSRFAIFYGKNGSDEGIFNVFTGEDKISDLNRIDSWNGQRKLNTWFGESCNAISGTPGDTFQPFVEKNETLQVFIPDLCRSFKLRFTEAVNYDGLETYRFEAPPSTVANATENPENACFCEGNCLPSGAQNMSECKFGSPIAFSFPHFLYGDPRYLQQMEGLKPDKEKHHLHMDIEPITGTPFEAKIRFQINAIIERIPGISHFEHLNNTVFPMIWIEQASIVNDQLFSLLMFATVKAYVYADIGSYVIMGTGTVIILAGVIYLLRQRYLLRHM